MAPPFRSNVRQRTATWYRADLHVHTPVSQDYRQEAVTFLDILNQAEQRGLDIIAFTDHNSVFGYASLRKEIEELAFLERLGRIQAEEQAVLDEYRRLLDRLLVLPGFELTASPGIHILAIFSETTPVRFLEHLLLRFGVPLEALDIGADDLERLADAATVCRVVDEAGGITIAAHANLARGLLTVDPGRGNEPRVHALEMAEARENRTRGAQAQRRQELIRRNRLIQNSNAHWLTRPEGEPNDRHGVGERVFEVQLEERTFEALRRVFRGDNFSLTRAYQPTPLPSSTPARGDWLQLLRARGASPTLAFHDYAPSRPNRILSIIEDIVAMANTDGGRLVIGAAAEPRGPVYGVEQPVELSEAIRREIDEAITPLPEVTIDLRPSGGKTLILIRVSAGANPPYYLDHERVLVRQGDRSIEADAARIEALRQKIVKRPAVHDATGLATATRGREPDRSRAVARLEPVPVAERFPLPAENATFQVPLPRTGAEIVDEQEREGICYFAIRDLRNGNIVRNVTRYSARHLWHYAIREREQNRFDPATVIWKGDIGLWQAYSRRGAHRYNLVARDEAGGLHVFYGVTEDGLEGPWLDLLPADDAELDEFDD